MPFFTRRQVLQAALATAATVLLEPEFAWAKAPPVHPFRFARELKKRARRSGHSLLDAGTGTPNFMHMPARQAHSDLYRAALKLSAESGGLRPRGADLANRLREAVETTLAGRVLDLAYQDADADQAADQLLQMLLGNTYSGFLPLADRAARGYLSGLVLGSASTEDFRLIPTKGASEALKILFSVLNKDGILGEGDRLAEFVPTFSPFLFSPGLKGRFEVEPVRLRSRGGRWTLPPEELQKLADPQVKACYLVDPGNPLPGAFSESEAKSIADLVKRENPELLILSDLVYAALPEKCHPLIRELPRNTIGICSWSKHFGATGWRMGAMMVHRDCVANKSLPEPLFKRLKSGGVILPQQAALTVFSLVTGTPEGRQYDRELKAKLKGRWQALYRGLGVSAPESPLLSHFFALVDVHRLANSKVRKLRGGQLDYFHRLADLGVVALPGSGFAGPEWTVRVSLASLTAEQCQTVGKAIVEAL